MTDRRRRPTGKTIAILAGVVLASITSCVQRNVASYRFVDSESNQPVLVDFVYVYSGVPRPEEEWRPIGVAPHDDLGGWDVYWEGSAPVFPEISAPGYENRVIELKPGRHTIAVSRKADANK